MLSKVPCLTVAQCAAIPFKYVQVRSYSGAVIVCNVAADKIKNRDKIKNNPDLKTFWYSYREATLNELINYRAISNPYLPF